VHLGLGRERWLDKLVVTWPSGKVQDLGRIDWVDGSFVVDEERGVQVFDPRPR